MMECKDCPNGDCKAWWTSRTFWFNGALTAISTGVLVGQEVLPILTPILDTQTVAIAGALIGAIGILLRFDTKKSITLPGRATGDEG